MESLDSVATESILEVQFN